MQRKHQGERCVACSNLYVTARGLNTGTAESFCTKLGRNYSCWKTCPRTFFSLLTKGSARLPILKNVRFGKIPIYYFKNESLPEKIQRHCLWYAITGWLATNGTIETTVGRNAKKCISGQLTFPPHPSPHHPFAVMNSAQTLSIHVAMLTTTLDCMKKLYWPFLSPFIRLAAWVGWDVTSFKKKLFVFTS